MEIYVHYTTDRVYFFSPPKTTSFDQYSKKKEFARQILFKNLSICPRKWSPYNTHHREAKDTQVKSTLKSRLSTNQTLSNRPLGAVRCFVSSSLIEGEPVCVWWSRKHSSFSVSSNKGSNLVVHCSGAAEQEAIIDPVPPVKRGLKPARTDQTPAVPSKPPRKLRKRRIHSRFTKV